MRAHAHTHTHTHYHTTTQLNRLPAGSLPTQQHIMRSALSIVIPIASFILYTAFGKVGCRALDAIHT